MKLLALTRGYLSKVDDEDYEKCLMYKWYPIINGRTIYATSYDKTFKPQVDLRLHWLIIGKPPQGYVVDHIDGDGLNNQKENLRICRKGDNNKNRKSYGFSKHLGVCWNKKNRKWMSRIQGKHLGSYNSEIEAAQAYNTEAIRLYGEYANLNKI